LREASEILGITTEAVQERIKHRTLDHERDSGTVYVFLPADQSVTGRQPDDQTTAQEKPDTRAEERDELVEILREQVTYLQGVISTRDEELARRDEEIKRRDDAARDREETLTISIAQRLSELAARRDGSPSIEQQVDTKLRRARALYKVHTVDWLTVSVLAVGAGVAAGFANPLTIMALASWLDNPFVMAALVLWALPSFFGLFLGRNIALVMASSDAAIEALDYQLISGEDRKKEIDRITSRRASVPRNLPIYAIVAGIAAMFGSLGALFGSGLGTPVFSTLTLYGIAIVQGLVAAMFVVFAGLIAIGSARRRSEKARQREGGGTAAEASAANRQALIGLLGTIITAVLGFLGTAVRVWGGGGGSGG